MLTACGDPRKHGPHGECCGVPLPEIEPRHRTLVRPEALPDAPVPVTCPYCGMTGDTDLAWRSVKETQRAHYLGRCEQLPWWRRWFTR